MKVALIAAISENFAIGKNNTLPWKIRDDMQLFVSLTKGHHIIMGRKTFESFGSKPLSGRTNIVISRNLDYETENCHTCSSYAEALNLARENGEEEAFVIGGGEIYKLAMYKADILYISHVHATIEGDTFFPAIDPELWTLTEKKHYPQSERNQFSFDFCIYKRISGSKTLE